MADGRMLIKNKYKVILWSSGLILLFISCFKVKMYKENFKKNLEIECQESNLRRICKIRRKTDTSQWHKPMISLAGKPMQENFKPLSLSLPSVSLSLPLSSMTTRHEQASKDWQSALQIHSCKHEKNMFGKKERHKGRDREINQRENTA